MKKIIYILGLSAALATACTDELDLQPKSDLTSGNFFNKTSDVELALIGCYDGLQQMSLNRDFVLMEMRSDVATSILAEGEFGYIDTFVKDIVESGDLYKYWKACFNALSRTNLVMDNIKVADESVRNRIEGETRFIRGLIYFNMVRLWGDLPLIDRTVLATEYEMFRRKPASEIYSKMILPDLEFATQNLPDMTKGKANAMAAKALLSKVYLTLNRHEDAKTLLASMIDFSNPSNSKVAQVSLAPEYSSIYSESTKWNSEILFAVQFNSASGEGQTFSYEFSSFGGFTGLNTPTAPFAVECDADPVRKNVNVIEEKNGLVYKICGKYMKAGTKPSQKDNGADVPILRYADVLLMYAEAVLGAPSNPYSNIMTTDPDAVAAYNAVRKRAGYDTDAVSVTRNELMQERKLEFAFENHRWFDLLRIAGATETIRIMEAHGQDPSLTAKQKFTKVEPFQLLYPIPGREIRVLGKEIISQNEGYN